jgi:glycosyltransferase involved in cell wall biosynthesis
LKIDPPLVSVVVTTKNEEMNIGICLRSLKNQSYRNIEIIVVDNFSSDKTKRIASDYTDLVFDFGPERSAQRNYGLMKVAKGEYGMYIDADMILSPSLIESCVEVAKNSTFASYYFPEVILGKSIFNIIRRFERKYYEATSIDAVRFFPIKSFIEVGGFDEDLFRNGSGEDWDLDKKLRNETRFTLLEKTEISPRFEPQLLEFLQKSLPKKSFSRHIGRVCIYHNESHLTFGKFLSKKIYYAQAFSGYKNKWGKDDKDVKRQFSVFYRLLVVFFRPGKGLSTLRNLHLFVGVIVYRLILFCAVAFSSRKILKRRSS